MDKYVKCRRLKKKKMRRLANSRCTVFNAKPAAYIVARRNKNKITMHLEFITVRSFPPVSSFIIPEKHTHTPDSYYLRNIYAQSHEEYCVQYNTNMYRVVARQVPTKLRREFLNVIWVRRNTSTGNRFYGNRFSFSSWPHLSDSKHGEKRRTTWRGRGNQTKTVSGVICRFNVSSVFRKCRKKLSSVKRFYLYVFLFLKLVSGINKPDRCSKQNRLFKCNDLSLLSNGE